MICLLRKALKNSTMNMVMSATKHKTVMMLEAEAKIVPITDVMQVSVPYFSFPSIFFLSLSPSPSAIPFLAVLYLSSLVLATSLFLLGFLTNSLPITSFLSFRA